MDLRNVLKDVEVCVLVFEVKQSHMFLFLMETIIHLLPRPQEWRSGSIRSAAT